MMDIKDDSKTKGTPDDILKSLQNGENPVVSSCDISYGTIRVLHLSDLKFSGIHNEISNVSSYEQDILRELKELQDHLEEAESVLADIIAELREAIEQKDERRKTYIIQTIFSNATASAILSALASKRLLVALRRIDSKGE